MKKPTKPQRPKTRYHKVLFDNDSPFKPKTIHPKNDYSRRPKYNPDYSDYLDDDFDWEDYQHR
jgi:hypothetical protein